MVSQKEPVKTPRAKPLAGKIRIASRGDGTSVSIGALTWSQTETTEARWLTDKDLRSSLQMVGAKKAIGADIVLCSGARIWTDRSKCSEETIASELVAAVGCPVLFEWGKGKRSTWVLATQDGLRVVRTDQFVAYSEEAASRGHLTLAEYHAGLGVVWVDSIGDNPTSRPLVLVICGEAFMFSAEPGQPVLSRGVQSVMAVPGFFSTGDWVMLHPTHRPCPHHSVREGFHHAGVVNAADPMLKRLVGRQKDQGGSHGPSAVVHASPFQPDNGVDEQAATVLFRRSKGGVTEDRAATSTIDGLVKVRYAEFMV